MCRLESIGLNTRVFNKSNVRRVDNAHVEHKRRMGAVRLVRGDVDLLVVMTHVWPQPSCVTDRRLWLYLDNIISNAPGRSIPLLLLDANGHTGLQMVQPKVWRPVSTDAIGPRFPQRENFNGGQLRLLSEKQIMTAINTDERFCCGPTYFGPPPLCTRTQW